MLKNYPRELFRAARVALDLTVPQMAELAKVSPTTLFRVEAIEKHVVTKTIDKVGEALEAQGIEFILRDGDKGPGFRLNKAAESQLAAKNFNSSSP